MSLDTLLEPVLFHCKSISYDSKISFFTWLIDKSNVVHHQKKYSIHRIHDISHLTDNDLNQLLNQSLSNCIHFYTLGNQRFETIFETINLQFETLFEYFTNHDFEALTNLEKSNLAKALVLCAYNCHMQSIYTPNFKVVWYVCCDEDSYCKGFEKYQDAKQHQNVLENNPLEKALSKNYYLWGTFEINSS